MPPQECPKIAYAVDWGRIRLIWLDASAAGARPRKSRASSAARNGLLDPERVHRARRIVGLIINLLSAHAPAPGAGPGTAHSGLSPASSPLRCGSESRRMPDRKRGDILIRRPVSTPRAGFGQRGELQAR